MSFNDTNKVLQPVFYILRNPLKRRRVVRKIMRGDLYYANLDPVIGSEQSGYRPVVIIQNNTGNRFSNTVIVAAVTSKPDVKANAFFEATCKTAAKKNP